MVLRRVIRVEEMCGLGGSDEMGGFLRRRRRSRVVARTAVWFHCLDMVR